MIALQFIAFILLGAAIILAPMFVLYGIIKLFWERFIEPPEAIVTRYPRSITDRIAVKIEHKNTQLILSSKFSYYQKLNEADQAKFLKRTSKFILSKHFRAKEMELTEEMVVLISASAIQLTFGLDEYLMDHFDKIFIYPSAFYSRMNKQYHKGETNLGGAIVLSWKHFTEGYSNPKDNLNLGLHEMAHALRFDKLKSDKYDKFFSEYIDKWQLIAQEEFQKIKNHQPSMLREYGGTNFPEFFSVCVEYFFESPVEFKKALPEIYKHLCILLNQDPSTRSTNYSLGNSFVSKDHFESGVPFLRYQNKKARLFWLFIGFLPLISFFCFLVYEDISIKDFTMLYIFFPIFIVSMTIKIIQSKKYISLYGNNMLLESTISERFNRRFDYDEIASVTLRRGQVKNEENSVVIRVISNGKIKKKGYVYSFENESEMKTMADFLAQKKIPVKIDGYYIK